MRHVPRFHIDFYGLRNVFFAISAVALIVSIGAIAVRGLDFGIEFRGGTVIDVQAAKGVSENDLRDAFQQEGISTESIQVDRE